MSPFYESLANSWQRGLMYGRELAYQTHPDDFTKIPVPGMNHAAWTLGHLNQCYEDILYLLGDPNFKEIEKDKRFIHDSKPIDDLAYYPNKDELVDAFEVGHNRVLKSLVTADPEVMAKPTGHKTLPTHGAMVVHLLTDHEWQHLGQFSAWRRAIGLATINM